MGASDNVTVFDAYVDQASVQEKLDAFYAGVSAEDQVLLMSDLIGGSVNQVMMTYLQKPNTTLIGGVNLACVLELSTKTEVTVEEIEQIVEQSRSMLSVVQLPDFNRRTRGFFLRKEEKEMIKLVRLDERLIHGQVAIKWSRHTGVDRDCRGQ